MKYGFYQADPPAGDITWFRTSGGLESGAYVRGHGSTPNVYIADSVAALLMQVTPAITAAEQAGQASLATPDMDANTRERISDELTDVLVARLSRDDGTWVDEPHWIRHLKPAGQAS